VPLGEVGAEVGAYGGQGTPGAYAEGVRVELCDDRGAAGFSWIVYEPATRASHALADGGNVWLVDPVRDDVALERALALGRPVAVVQLLDRHNRDCAAIAEELDIPHLVVPDVVRDSPFAAIALTRRRRWHETALWWPEARTLVVAEAIGTNRFFTAGREVAGVHLLLRLAPPRGALGGLEPEHLLVGHGRGVHGPAAAAALQDALNGSRSGLPRLLAHVPGLAADAIRRRRSG
jgi:hypothetical protein